MNQIENEWMQLLSNYLLMQPFTKNKNEKKSEIVLTNFINVLIQPSVNIYRKSGMFSSKMSVLSWIPFDHKHASQWISSQITKSNALFC